MLNNFDFTKDRPLIDQSNVALNLLSIACFPNNDLNLEIATLIYEELKLRNSSCSKSVLSNLLSKFSSVNHEPIKWLKEARLMIKKIKDVDTKPQYTNSIYIILRDGYTNQNQKYGVYVGQTSKTVKERFIEHKSGLNSGRGLEKYGIQILKSLWIHGKVKGSKRLFYETKIHIALEEVIPKVSGDINIGLLENK